MSESKAAEQQQSPQERDAQIVADAMQDHGKHYWCLVRALKRKKKGWWDLANLIGEGSTVAKAIWEKYDVELPPNYPAAGAPAQQGVTTSRKDEIAHVMMEKFHEHLQDCVGGCPYCHQIVHEYEAEVRALAAPPVSEGLKCVHCRLPLETCQGQKWETEIINSTRINWRRDEETGTYIAEFPRILDAATSKDFAIELLKKSVKYTSHLFDTGEHDYQLLAHPSPFLNPPLSEEPRNTLTEWEQDISRALGYEHPILLWDACEQISGLVQEFKAREQSKSSPREPDTQAGPRCPKCGKSGTLEFHGSEVFAAYVECHDDDCDFDLAANEVGELAQFFPSPEQGWVKEVARLAFGRGGPIADWYCWCEICCLLRRVLPAPPRPSTEEGK